MKKTNKVRSEEKNAALAVLSSTKFKAIEQYHNVNGLPMIYMEEEMPPQISISIAVAERKPFPFWVAACAVIAVALIVI